MLNCRQTAQLISQSLDCRLPLRQRLRMRLHLSLCRACATYRSQIELLDRIIRRQFDASSNPQDLTDLPPCPEQTKSRITAALSTPSD